MIKRGYILILFLLFSSSAWAAPVIYYADLIYGPNTGGQNNNGAFVTIWGRDFGHTQGTSTITVGGGAVANYPVWSDTNVIFQLGSFTATGNILITVKGKTASSAQCNPSFQFTINNSMEIYFVDGESDAGGSGTYDSPYTTPASFVTHLEARGDKIGDILYFRTGTYTGHYGDTTYQMANFMLTSDHEGIPSAPVVWVAYPGEVVKIDNNLPCGSYHSYAFTLGEGSTATSADYTTISSFTLEGECSDIVNQGAGSNYNQNEVGPVGMRLIGCTIDALYENEDTQSGIVVINADNASIFGNTIRNNASSPTNTNHAIYLQSGADSARIGYNTIRAVCGHTIQTHADGGGALVYTNNHFYNNDIASPDNNPNNCRGFSFSLIHPTSTAYIYNNILHDLGQDFSAVHIYNGTVYIVNNTFYNIRARASQYASIVQSSGQYGGDNSDPYPYVYNNIFWAPSDGDTAYVSIDQGGTFEAIDSNLYYGNGLQSFPVGGQADVNALNNIDPGLTNPGSDDFTVASAGSHIVNAGIDASTNVASITMDFINNSRSGSDTIGAYEFAPHTKTGILPAQFLLLILSPM